MAPGAGIVDPATTWIDAGVELEADCTIHPFTVLRGTTRVAAGAEVGPHVVAIDAAIGPRTTVGPFCYLRPGTVLEAGAKAGTFVEIKNTRVGEGTKVPHLSYIGDADIGEGTNIGAGGVTANYPHRPGQPKARTTIGRNVRTAIHNVFVAPVEIGDDAWLAAGTVITDDVPPGSLAGFRRGRSQRRGMSTISETIELTELAGSRAGRGASGAARPGTSSSAGTQRRLMLFSGARTPSSPAKIGERLGVEFGEVTLKTFANGEVYCRFEESIRGADVFIVQTGCVPVDTPPDGALLHDPGRQARLGQADHRRHPALPVRAPGPQGAAARADLRAAGRRLPADSPAPTGC